jgi:hypothetical protein
MGKAEKKGILLPPAVGYSVGVVIHLLSRYRLSWRFVPRTLATLLINFVNMPFRWVEKTFVNHRFRSARGNNPPVFIVGHWRSGTTYLHNILCQDPKMAYTTTFQSVFPDTLFSWIGRPLFEGFARILIPGKRKGDNVILGTELPQEEELALGDKQPLCYYYCWMFPRNMQEFYERSIRFNGVSERDGSRWMDNYQLLMNKAMKNTKGDYFLSKNPANTGRVKALLERFPGARFIHIHRDPVEVFLSTRNFFEKMLPHLQLQSVDFDSLEEDLVEVYRKLMQDFIRQRKEIPKGQLVELSFHELEARPMELVAHIYETLGMELGEEAIEKMEAYIRSKKSYSKNKYQLSPQLSEKIKKEWDFARKEWQYDRTSPVNSEKDD